MDDIFNGWKKREIHKNSFFYSDGIISKDSWENTNFKILFILKEAYQDKELTGCRDLSDRIKVKHKASGRTFKPLGQWAYGLQNLKKDGFIKDFISDGSLIDNALLSTALINIKKSGGNKKSKKLDLKKYIDSDWDLIQEQISSINPDLIVCGNTWSLLKSKLKSIECISEKIYEADGHIYLSFWHPSNHASNLMNYYALCALAQKAIDNKKL